MLVVISDLHLTDDGASATVPATAFRIFRERLRDLAYDASWRRDGTYRPVEELDLVMLGDVLDLIRSDRWPCVAPGDPTYVRPWSDPGGALAAKIEEITGAILEQNEAALAVIRSLHSDRVMTLPPAVNGRPADVGREPDAAGRVPVAVRVHYVAGNHDWFLHLPGEAYNRIRRRVVSSMCLATAADRPFPTEPGECPLLTRAAEQHQAFFRHGDCFDTINFEQQRGRASIGDAIVIDLVTRFAVMVRRDLGDQLPRECIDGLRQIDCVRPLLAVPIWVDGLLRRTCPNTALAKRVKTVWDELADEFLELPWVRARRSFLPALTLEKLALALKFSRGASFPIMAGLMSWLHDKIPTGNDRPTCNDALHEAAYREGGARSIVYGHTHAERVVPLAAAPPFSRVYLNCGTWRMVQEQAQQAPRDETFVPHWVMTYAALYRGDERGGRPYETWSGALADMEA